MQKMIVAMIHAKHPRAVEFNCKLVKAQEERETIVSDLAKEAKEKHDEAGQVFDYAVVDATKEPFLPKEVKDMEPIRVVRKWTNRRVHELIAEYYGSTVKKAEAIEVSVVYYRVNDVLVTAGSGSTLIKPYSQCTEEEWQELRAGRVGKFIKLAA